MTRAEPSVQETGTDETVDESRIDYRTDWEIPESSVRTSVVIVTYQVSKDDFERTLSALAQQTASAYELLVVDNGTEWNVESALAAFDRCRSYVRLDGNRGVTVARNVGSRLARGDLLVFLDDDAVPESDFVAAHRRLHDQEDVVAARGRVFPRKKTLYNRLQTHYDMGPEACPHFINIEGNTSFDRETFLDYGGFTEELTGRAGHEGLELTYRMVAEGDVDRDQVVYFPDAVIYHDYAENFSDFVIKRTDRSTMATHLDGENDNLFGFARSYSRSSQGDVDLGVLDYVRVAMLELTVRLVRHLPRTG